jgi:hypothetical protein
MEDKTLEYLLELRRTSPLVRALPRWMWRLVLRAYRRYVWLMRQPVLRASCVVLGFLVVLGALYAFEPFGLLRWRRRRVVPLRLKPTGWQWLKGVADKLQLQVQRPAVRILVGIPQALIAIAMLPFLVCAALVLVPSRARSVLVLTLAPVGIVCGFNAAVREARSALGLPPRARAGSLATQLGVLCGGATAWLLILAVVVVTRAYWPTFADWAVGDVPLGVYMVFLAVAMVFATIATVVRRDNQRQPGQSAESGDALQVYHRDLLGVTMLAFVLGIWVMRLLNPLLFDRGRLMRGGIP